MKEPCTNVFLKKWFLYTARPIKAGEELLLNYGKYYWK
jgi:SET domain-containing protein